MKSTSRVVALVGLVSLVVAGISPPVSAQAPLKIRIGWVVAPAQLTPMLFEKKEILKHYGKSYTVEPVHFRGSTPQITALAAGELEIAALAYSSFPLAVLNAKLDARDLAKPRYVSGLDWSPPFVCPTHTALPIPFPLRGRRILLVADEDVLHAGSGPPAFLWLVDVTDETRPVPFSSFQIADLDGSPQPEYTGCHQPCEDVTGTEILVAWFDHGPRIIDIVNPHAPREVASFVPPVPEGASRVSSNDVTVDGRGLLYLLDRSRGMHIVERT